MPDCSKIIVEGEPPVPICILGDPAYPLLPYIMKEFASGGKNEEQQFFGYRLSSAKIVIECAFGRLKPRFGCLRRDMDINLDDLKYVIHSCFILHNFCEIHKEPINPQYVTASLKYDSEFQPPTHGGYKINNNEGNSKKRRNIMSSISLKHFLNFKSFSTNDKEFRNRNFNILIPQQRLRGVLFKTCSKNFEKGFEKYL